MKRFLAGLFLCTAAQANFVDTNVAAVAAPIAPTSSYASGASTQKYHIDTLGFSWTAGYSFATLKRPGFSVVNATPVLGLVTNLDKTSHTLRGMSNTLSFEGDYALRNCTMVGFRFGYTIFSKKKTFDPYLYEGKTLMGGFGRSSMTVRRRGNFALDLRIGVRCLRTLFALNVGGALVSFGGSGRAFIGVPTDVSFDLKNTRRLFLTVGPEIQFNVTESFAMTVMYQAMFGKFSAKIKPSSIVFNDASINPTQKADTLANLQNVHGKAKMAFLSRISLGFKFLMPTAR